MASGQRVGEGEQYLARMAERFPFLHPSRIMDAQRRKPGKRKGAVCACCKGGAGKIVVLWELQSGMSTCVVWTHLSNASVVISWFELMRPQTVMFAAQTRTARDKQCVLQ